MCFLRSGPAIETRAALNDERYHGRDVGRRVINLVNFVRNRNNLLRAICRRPATIKGRRTGGGGLQQRDATQCRGKLDYPSTGLADGPAAVSESVSGRRARGEKGREIPQGRGETSLDHVFIDRKRNRW